MADEQELHQLEERLMNDDNLLEDFKRRPHEVLEAHGISLSETQREKAKGKGFEHKSNDEVRSQIRGEGGLGACML